MDVKAINSISLQQNFKGYSKIEKNRNHAEYPQMDRPASKKASKALKDTAMALMLLGATAGGVSSCVKVDSWAFTESWAWSLCEGCHKPDTIFQITPIKEINWAINDSIKNQFINLGAEVDGPIDGDNVLLFSGTLRDKYDNEVAKFQVDSTGCNKDQMMYVSKLNNNYNPDDPKTKWVKTIAEDVPGKGIKYTFSTSDSETKPQPWQYNHAFSVIVSNGARGNKPGVNTIYDKDGKMIWQGELTKGQQLGCFFYSTFALDEDGNPYINPETGEPELVNYNYDNCKICTREVTYKTFTQAPNPNDFEL